MRHHSIDFLRGLSVTGMILFHANYLLEHVFDRDIIPFEDGFWSILGFIVAVIFITLAGVVSVLSSEGKSMRDRVRKTLKRTFILSLLALTISLFSYTLIPEQGISWGILHFLALASLLGILSVRGGYINLLIGVGFLTLPHLSLPTYHSILLIPLGFPPGDYYSADYYPLIPWLGYYLIGQGIGYLISKYSLLSTLDSYAPRSSILRFLGRNALVVYMVHVPILYGIFLFLFSLVARVLPLY